MNISIILSITNPLVFMKDLFLNKGFRNNTIVLFVLFYSLYFGFYAGLPLALNFSYIAATVWTMFLLVLFSIFVLKTVIILITFIQNTIPHPRRLIRYFRNKSGFLSRNRQSFLSD